MKRTILKILPATLAATFALFATGTAHASTADIANAPMATTSDSVVNPNIMFALDDSGSMSFTYLPDDAKQFLGKFGYASSQCNAAYYNPATVYAPPIDATGTSYSNSVFSAALTDGFNTSSSKVDLSARFIINQFAPEAANSWYSDYSFGSYIGRPQSAVPAFYFTYSGAQAAKNYNDTNSAFYVECNTATDDTSTESKNLRGRTVLVKSLFTKHVVSATSGPNGTDERTNFANWYSYYRTRMLAMKTSASRAFASIGDHYRVGYLTINNNTGSDYLNIDDFNNTQKASWYAKLFAAIPHNGTPLRSALATAGLVYAGKMNGRTLNGSTVTDPIQYSCQQNFTILSTDGYWNDGNDSGCSHRGGGGCQIDRTTAVGDQDSGANAVRNEMLDAFKKADTLSDVAMYYYTTDLRTPDLPNCTGALGSGTDVCKNNVPYPPTDVDKNAKQHMTTFTLGLGVNGTLQYSEDYLSGGSTDYNAIKQGTKNWPDPTLSEGPARIDDLWHAAVNGRGTYFSAANPASLVAGLSRALAGVSARNGSAAAAGTSTMEPVSGDNYAYVALYRTVNWDGDLQARTIDPSNGDISPTSTWTAQSLLDGNVSATADTRTIYTFNDGGNTGLKSFTWNSLTTTEQDYFNGMCSPLSKLSQCPSLTTDQRAATSGVNLVNFIRGQNGYEQRSGNTTQVYRRREHVLGDMIGSQPVYVKLPPFNYADTNYATFRDTTQKNRAGIVYVAANDGMLHAFNADTGVEQWAYIPPTVMPELYKLADANYSAHHQYYVDGPPTVGDICPNAPGSACAANQWKTILVGGLNAGGRGYYALDITDPAHPKGLWNFSVGDDADLGYTFGNPIITKRKDGTWVAVFSSGYNNVNPGDGKGYLYVLNAYTGALLEKIGTATGDTTTPSGLAKINAWVDATTSNTAARFYGGDLLGNIWRFDIDDNVPPSGKEAFLLAQLGQVGGADIQPVTTKPELTQITVGGVSHAVVNVGTGRYLGTSDLSDDSMQSVYALKDNLTSTGLGLVRTSGVLVKQTLITLSDGVTRTTSTNAVDWATQSGWYVDLPSTGERVNVDMQQQLGLLTVVGNVPNSDACTLGGYAWFYNFDYKTGQFVSSADGHVAGTKLGTNALVAGIKTIKLTTGKTVTIVTDTGGNIFGENNPSSNTNPGNGAKRVSWRALID
jgi:type IV pilus assembly protein PilY1